MLAYTQRPSSALNSARRYSLGLDGSQDIVDGDRIVALEFRASQLSAPVAIGHTMLYSWERGIASRAQRMHYRSRI